ncbi:type I 3-dehydroquinate dehydratase [Pseudomonas eucalypticola]|uniref:3-dehydroquinate dehydratase n=1 Tax=Pseudomonas eucalypticola TaxID=2599595 RepID=A0A7D5HDQ7_9PSED|nr:type I 3-dehydroquinate dehydratase [Pseudomonas eucalypticola]QKZ04930.1 type I 3-dehydroquinate dehydratase [Pseudomonas eucalypticola]
MQADSRGRQVLTLKGLDIGAGVPRIIASITGKGLTEAVDQAQAIAQTHAVDIAELRVDCLREPIEPMHVIDLVRRVAARLAGKPLIVTLRSEGEGGECTLADADYFALYAALLQDAPLDALDVEMMKPQAQVMDIIAKAHARGVAVVLSNHDFTATPAHEVIIQRLRRQQAMGADVLKLAAMPTCAKDVLTLMAATQEMHALYAERPLLTMSMGPLGVTSRLAGQLTGGALTYASVGAPSAPGQLDAEAVRQVLGIIDRGANG